MIMSDEVKQALQTLRDNATNDFEHHRIDLLERDLTSSPKVEIVDAKHQRFLGISFRKRKEGHYFTPQLSIYRFVWLYYYGEVPERTIIHHIDHNKDNNDISNLVPMFPADHRKHHAKDGHKQPLKAVLTCSICGKTYQGFYTGQNKYCPDCRKKYERERARAKRQPKPPKPPRVRQCVVCGKSFELKPKTSMTKGRKTCSPECEQILRDSKRVDRRRVDRRRICEVCGKPFEYKKNPQQKACSPECGKILSARAIKGRHVVERIISHCELCGKPIEHLPHEHPRFCSQDCVHKYMAQVNTKTEHVSPKEIRTCIVCGKPFEVTKSAAKQYCSSECYKQLKMKPCAICGKMFYSPNRNHKCCSRKCGDKLKSITWQKKRENK